MQHTYSRNSGRWIAPLTAAMAAATVLAAAGELPWIAPAEVHPVPYQADLQHGGALKVSLKDSAYLITSEYSLIPGWAKLAADQATGFKKMDAKKESLAAETEAFTLERKLIRHPECLEVADTLVNQTDDNLPVMIRHSCALPEVAEYRVNGRQVFLKRVLSSDPSNPTIVCVTPRGSLGILALDDVFRVHSMIFAVAGAYGVADNNLVLNPKAAHTVRFAVFPSEAKDYYSQINAMRRLLDVNFTLDGPAATCEPRPAGAKNGKGDPLPDRASSVEYLRNFFVNKSARYNISGREERLPNGRYAEGPDWLPVADPQLHKDFKARLQEAVPGLKVSMYFANNFYAAPDGQTKYAGCQVRNPDGSQADYRDPNYPLWLAIEGNAYAKDLEKTLEFIMDTIDYDVYWDEFEQSAAPYHYGEPWDGVTADIDAVTHKIARLKSSVCLLTTPWRVKQVQRILAKRGYLISNTGPYTETMTKIHFFRFTETGSLANCLKMHLYTPLALGDHITEKSESDCYRSMVSALHYGCVYYWYHDQIQPITHKTLTEYMFPITPVELGEDYLIAKERILTARSGWFSFGDKSAAEAHCYGADGVEVKRKPPECEKDGKRFFKVELGNGESCALVRK